MERSLVKTTMAHILRRNVCAGGTICFNYNACFVSVCASDYKHFGTFTVTTEQLKFQNTKLSRLETENATINRPKIT